MSAIILVCLVCLIVGIYLAKRYPVIQLLYMYCGCCSVALVVALLMHLHAIREFIGPGAAFDRTLLDGLFVQLLMVGCGYFIFVSSILIGNRGAANRAAAIFKDGKLIFGDNDTKGKADE